MKITKGLAIIIDGVKFSCWKIQKLNHNYQLPLAPPPPELPPPPEKLLDELLPPELEPKEWVPDDEKVFFI
jgi:hypothetical protein